MENSLERPKMRCEEAMLLVEAMVDGNIKPHEEHRLREHLKSCARCRAFAGREERLWALLAGWRGIDPSADLVGRVMERVHATRRPVWRRLAAAAALAAAVLVAVVLLHGTAATDVDPAVAEQVVESAEFFENLEVVEELTEEEMELVTLLDVLQEMDELVLESDR